VAWSPWDWRERPVEQQPQWPDPGELEAVEKELSGYPPLVVTSEIRDLQQALATAASGGAFLLQAGDCAESFLDHSAASVRNKLQVILQMAVVLMYSSGVPIIKVGRIAGQFAKPRSSSTETIGDRTLPSFRGHIVHSDIPDPIARIPDPKRLLHAYHQSAATIALLKSLTQGGFADLSQVHTWNQEFVSASSQGKRYETIATEIERALQFMAACGIDLSRERSLSQVGFWTSHEALLLGYEAALTRRDPRDGRWYDQSAHMVWIGERTRQLHGGHLRFAEGIANPIGCKVGPTMTTSELVELCDRLDPTATPGRLTLVSRMGAERVRDRLPELIAAVKASGHPVVWACDPMHGNTFTSSSGLKTRRFDEILAELKAFFQVHRDLGTWAGGIHIELTGDDVTECLGGSDEVLEETLNTSYNTICDPRLNAQQSLDLAYRVAELLITP
jgi:3-deoxy-7-phosphoheptulonate synthase